MFIKNLPSVSYRCTHFLYGVFNFLSLMCFIKCASQYFKERISICSQLRYKFNILREGSRRLIWTPFVHSPERYLSPVNFCNYKCVNIGLFPIVLPLHIHTLSITMNQHTAHNHSGHYTMQVKGLSGPY
jgi:hypothetical protein